ncbi:MAG: FtsX-like permease family protein [Planctomycetales bacterium]|nr:FtsX-like permease family protein [Planctomycetales bacterium]
MSNLMMRLLGRIPLGWLQLVSNKLRFAAAASGVGFACILVFVQLGMMGAFSDATRLSYSGFRADIMISASDSHELFDGSNVARRRMYQALAVPGVQQACPLFVGMTPWQQADGSTVEFRTLGIDPELDSFFGPEMGDIEALKLGNSALVDRHARGLQPDLLSHVTREQPLKFEGLGQQLSIVGTVSFGGGFAGDGFMFVSNQTFMRLFASRFSGAPNHILLRVAPGEDVDVVARRVRQALEVPSLQIRSLAQAIEQDVKYQTTVRPTGLIFGFGVAIGIVVGIVIVYQILSTDVADHLREYATFKAMGYSQGYFRSVIIEEAIILAVAGFFPALIASLTIYAVMAKATGLPIEMGPDRALLVLVGTVASCSLSGMIAMRKLATADPADLF